MNVVQRARAHGLTSERGRHLNEQYCLLESFNEDSGRYSCRFDFEKDNMHLRPENVEVVFKVAPVPGKGLGLVATRPLKKYDVIFREKPLMSFPIRGAGLAFTIEEALEAFGRQDDDVKAGIMDLADSFTSTKTLDGILRTNMIVSTGDSGGHMEACLYPLVSRVNHSCCPNTTHFTPRHSGGGGVLFAARDIKEGEELCYSYFADEGIFQSRENRQKQLAQQDAFQCTCEACVLPGGKKLKQSDKNRKRIWKTIKKQGFDVGHLSIKGGRGTGGRGCNKVGISLKQSVLYKWSTFFSVFFRIWRDGAEV